MVRLERLLSNRGYCARSDANAYLRQHEVLCAGKRELKGDIRVKPESVTIDGIPIDPEFYVLLMNKPLGVTCSHKDEGDIIYSLLPERWRYRDPPIATVGRLDKETSGIILLTDDGALLHRLTSPKHHVDRVYLAGLDRDLKGNEKELFAAGTLMLEGETKPLLPAGFEALSPRLARLTLHEGRYHQVRRMFAALGNHVLTLERERFGRLTTEGLAPGEHRVLTREQLAAGTNVSA